MEIFATAMPTLGAARALVFQPVQLMVLMAGVLLGLSIGVLPGPGGLAGLSLVPPFMIGMDPISGLALMVGLIAVISTSDPLSSVLLGIAGASASQATVLGRFPRAKKGQAARALILAFGLPELPMITELALSMVAILAGRVPLKGVVAAGMGLMVGTIGAAGAGGALHMRLSPETDEAFIEPGSGGDDAAAPHGLWWTLSWFLFLLLATCVTGLIIALSQFFVLFLRSRGGMGWAASVGYGALGIAFILFLARVLGRDFPPGPLQSCVDLLLPLT